MLLHLELRETTTGNCIQLEKNSILTCNAPIRRINKTRNKFRTIELEETDLQEMDAEFLRLIASSEASEFFK